MGQTSGTHGCYMDASSHSTDKRLFSGENQPRLIQSGVCPEWRGRQEVAAAQTLINDCHHNRACKTGKRAPKKPHRRPTKGEALGTGEGKRCAEPLSGAEGGERPEGAKASWGPRGNSRGGFGGGEAGPRLEGAAVPRRGEAPRGGPGPRGAELSSRAGHPPRPYGRRGGKGEGGGGTGGTRAAASGGTRCPLPPAPTAAAEGRPGRRRETRGGAGPRGRARAHPPPHTPFLRPWRQRSPSSSRPSWSSALTRSRLHLAPTPPVPGRAAATRRDRASPERAPRPRHRRPAPRNRGSARPAPPCLGDTRRAPPIRVERRG